MVFLCPKERRSAGLTVGNAMLVQRCVIWGKIVVLQNLEVGI